MMESAGVSRLSSSSCSSSSINPGSSTVFNRYDANLSKCMPVHVDKGIPSASFRNSFSTNDWSMVSVTPRCDNGSTMFSQRSDSIYSNQPNKSVSPLIQPVDQSLGYDSSRLPSSIFSSKPATPYDWSVASNESLFSITNYSFKKDQAFLDIMPEQLGPIGETRNPNTDNLDNKAATQHERKQSSDMNVNDNATREGPHKSDNDHNKVQSCIGVERTSTSSSATQQSEESEKSKDSFVFPVLVNGVKKSSSSPTKRLNKKSKTRWCFSSCSRPWPWGHSCCKKTLEDEQTRIVTSPH